MGAALPIVILGAFIAYLFLSKSKKAEPGELAVTPEDKEAIKKAIDKIDAKLPTMLTSPLLNVNDLAWTRYVQWAKKDAKLSTISANYNLGMFLINMRTLEDFGHAKNVIKQDYQGRQVWKGEWVSPYSLDSFLTSPMIQYQIFAKMTANHANAIKSRYSNFLDTDIDGKKATLSGLLGVAKIAGLGGLDSWLKDPKSRKALTNEAFSETTGMF